MKLTAEIVYMKLMWMIRHLHAIFNVIFFASSID